MDDIEPSKEPHLSAPSSAAPLFETSADADGEYDRDAVLARFHSVRQTTLDLAAPLHPEDQVVQSMPDASPTKWHLAHVTWFFETFLLKDHLADYRQYNDAYAYLFNSYYEALAPYFHRPERGVLSRPTVAEVRDYRTEVDRRMTDLIETASSGRWSEIAPLVVLGLHHEQQHQELILTDLKHMLSRNPLRPAYRADLRPCLEREASPLAWCEFEGGIQEIGFDGHGFAYDNESPHHKIYLEPFRIATRPVTNGEFMAFVQDGGYAEPLHWLSNGWTTVTSEKWAHPLYWTRHDDGHWSEFTLGGERPFDPAAPASHLSFYEADAYARWAGKRLPSESEWEIAARDIAPDGNLLETDHLHPMAAGETGGGLVQLYGDVWEWTASPYAPYPGFRPAQGAVGEYNGKFMCEQMVLRGGSCVTPPAHIRPTYRNFFPCNTRWQFSGIRLADGV